MWYSELNVVGTRAVRSLGSFVPLPQSISHRACCYTPLVWSYDMQGFLVKCEETCYKNNCSNPSFARIHLHSLYSFVKLLRMRRESRESPGLSDPDMHHGTCVTHVSWCMSGSLTSVSFEVGCGENVPGIPGECTTPNFTYLARGP